MNTRTLIVAGAIAALGYFVWRRQRDTVTQTPASKLESLAASLTGSVRLNGERWG